VIRIEPPATAGRPELMTGPRDGADMVNLHRNKRLMTLDLKADGGREVLRRLVRTTDVMVENYRPDVKFPERALRRGRHGSCTTFTMSQQHYRYSLMGSAR
jgi:hypothetical protein